MIMRCTILSMLFVVGLSGCGKKDDDKGGGAAGPVSDADGVWSSPCTDRGFLSMKNGITVAAGGITVSQSLYSDATCATIMSLSVITSTFTAGNVVSAPAGAKEYNSSVTAATLTLYTDEGVSAANASGSKICAGGFTKGVAKTLTAADCANDNKNVFGDRFSIYKVDGSKLYLGNCGSSGQTTDCSSATKLPTAFETTPYTKG